MESLVRKELNEGAKVEIHAVGHLLSAKLTHSSRSKYLGARMVVSTGPTIREVLIRLEKKLGLIEVGDQESLFTE